MDLSSCLPQLTFYKIHGLTHKENIHSKFLAFLLNPEKKPKEKHGCGSAFLDLFIKMLNEKINNEQLNLTSLDVNDYHKAIPETGCEINRKDVSGGRVDICICKTFEDKKKKIIIENKINAIDQWAQLLRIRNTYPCSTIVYLTLSGKEASSYSLNYQDKILEKKDYIRISYKYDIWKWLNDCLKYLQNNCMLDKKQKNKLSVLLNDYLTVIKELTYTEKINDIILPKLSKDENTIKYLFEHREVRKMINKIINEKAKCEYSTIFNLKEYLVRKYFINVILDKIAMNISDDLIGKTIDGKNIMQKGWGFRFHKTKWEKANRRIVFYFRKKNLEDCYYGIRKSDPTQDNKSVWYYHKKVVGEYSNWHKKVFCQFMPDYKPGEKDKHTFYDFILEKITEMCKIIENEV
jgi:hypothetical protein